MKRYLRALAIALLAAALVLGTGALAEGAVRKVSIPKKLTIQAGETYQLEPKLTPADAATTYTWKSKNADIAEVDGSGLITARKAGKTTVTVRTANNKKATCAVTVTPIAMTNFAFEGTTIDGEKYPLFDVNENREYDIDVAFHRIPYSLADVEPDNADTTVSWTSSNKKVATISKEGVVTCKKAGVTTITAKAKYGGLKRSFELTVIPNESSWTVEEALGDLTNYTAYHENEIYTRGKRLYSKGGKLIAELYVYNRYHRTMVSSAGLHDLHLLQLNYDDGTQSWIWDPYGPGKYAHGSLLGVFKAKVNKKIPPNKVGTMTITVGKIDMSQAYLIGYQFMTVEDDTNGFRYKGAEDGFASTPLRKLHMPIDKRLLMKMGIR